MDNVESKLAQCFALAFPQMDPTAYRTASAENTSSWDSMTQITLLTVISEEFGIAIDFEEFEGATSFESLANRLREIAANA